MRTCEVEGCEGKHTAKGLCNKHYRTHRKALLNPDYKPRIIRQGCEVEGCEEKHEAKGLCSNHYYKKFRATPEIKQRGKEYNAKYRAKNKQRIKERKAKYYAENIQRERERIRKNSAKYYADPVNKQKAKEYRSAPEVKQRIREYLKEYYARPEVKQRMKEYRSAPEVKQRIREYYARPEVKQRMKEYNAKPEVKQKKKEYYARPEVKQRMREYQKKNYKNNYVRKGSVGHQPDAPNYVYIVANDELGAAKVGIGTRGRVANHTSKGWEVVYLSPLMTKRDAVKLERAIIGFHGVGGVVPGRHLTKEEMPDGYTETFDLQELDAVLGIMPILCGESDRINQEEKAG